MADEALTKAVDTLTSQLQEKNDTLLELQSQLSQREAYIAQLHRVIIANGGAVPGPQVSAQASSPSTNGEVKEGLSKSQKKRQRRQQKQQIEAKVTPLQEQAAATPSESTTAEPSATPKKNVESGSGAASKKRKRTQGEAEQGKESAEEKAKTSPAPKEKQQAKKQETTPKKEAGKSRESKNVRQLKNGLKLEDTKIGTGKVATLGKRVSVLYKGFLTNGKSFDSSLNKPFTFRLGVGEVIKGWDTGVVGMKVGGRRKLVIPAKLGYGRQSMAGIPANSTLLFEVELVAVK